MSLRIQPYVSIEPNDGKPYVYIQYSESATLQGRYPIDEQGGRWAGEDFVSLGFRPSYMSSSSLDHPEDEGSTYEAVDAFESGFKRGYAENVTPELMAKISPDEVSRDALL